MTRSDPPASQPRVGGSETWPIVILPLLHGSCGKLGGSMIGVEWLKQRVISWLLSRYVGSGSAWTGQTCGQRRGKCLDAHRRRSPVAARCLDSLGVPFAIRSGSVKKLTVVWSETGPAATIQILVDTVFVVLQSTDARHLSAEQVNAAEQQAKRALLENRRRSSTAACIRRCCKRRRTSHRCTGTPKEEFFTAFCLTRKA